MRIFGYKTSGDGTTFDEARDVLIVLDEDTIDQIVTGLSDLLDF